MSASRSVLLRSLPPRAAIAKPAPRGADRLAALLAAAEVFAARGYQATEIADLEAALPPALDFSALFSGKGECFAELHGRILAEARECLLLAVSPRAPWPERVATALAVLFDLIAAEPGAARVVFLCAPSSALSLFPAPENVLAPLAPALAEGRLQPGAAADLPVGIESSMLAGLVHLIVGRIDQDLAPIYPEALAFLLGPYLGPDHARAFAAGRRPRPG